jgi:hypothetical protein
MKHLLSYLIIAFIIASCGSSSSIDERKIITDILQDIIVIEDDSIPPFPDSLRTNINKDSLYRENIFIKNECREKIVFIDDSLRRLTNETIGQIQKAAIQDNYSELELGLIKNLTSIEYEKRITIPSPIKINGFTIILFNKEEIGRKYKGVVHFSNFVFDVNENLGCFYYEMVCGGECGSTNIVFFKNKNGHYVITKSNLLSIS